MLARPSGPHLLRPLRPAAALLRDAHALERSGCIAEAIAGYESVITAAEKSGARATLSEALRRLAVLRHQRDESAQAQALCRRSYELAQEIGNDLLVAEALNTLGGLDLTAGFLKEAREKFFRALDLAGSSRELRARAEQNLGILANIHGDLDEAVARYQRSLEAYRDSGNEHGCAIAYHNLGMASADRELWDEAERYYGKSYQIAERAGDRYLQGLCLLNRAAMQVERHDFEKAQRQAEAALAIFDQLGARAETAGARRVIGMIYRETGHPEPAESSLRKAIELAVAAGSPLNEADASRELALVYQAMGRNQEALSLLNVAHRLFHRLDARNALVNVDRRVAELEGTYLAVVREWGQSIESSDSYTFGHCGRVADNAVAVAQALGMDDNEITTIRLGAYLHDVGKVKLPLEILNKPGPLTREEIEIVRMHPVWGIELLADVEFPWDLKPIIRWHHERCDGSGYPDRLKGDAFPLAAQIVGIVDVYDALTTTRSYRGAMPVEQAIARITQICDSWSPRVYQTFMRAVGEPALAGEQRQELAA